MYKFLLDTSDTLYYYIVIQSTSKEVREVVKKEGQFIPDIVVIGEGKSTNVIIKGMEFGNCISDFEYSATDSLGNLKPTVKLIEVNVETFNPKDGSDTFARLQRMFEKKEADAKETATASE